MELSAKQADVHRAAAASTESSLQMLLYLMKLLTVVDGFNQ